MDNILCMTKMISDMQACVLKQLNEFQAKQYELSEQFDINGSSQQQQSDQNLDYILPPPQQQQQPPDYKNEQMEPPLVRKLKRNDGQPSRFGFQTYYRQEDRLEIERALKEAKRLVSLQMEDNLILLQKLEDSLQNNRVVFEKSCATFKGSFERMSGIEFKLTPLAYDVQLANYSEICRKNFGMDFRVADWSDIEDVLQVLPSQSLPQFASYLGFSADQNDFAITREGNPKFSSARYYFLSYHNHKLPQNYLAHAQLQEHTFSLGSWLGSKRILCVSNEKNKSS